MKSTVAKKAVMAVTGLILVIFLLFHMYGNLKMFAGPADFDRYAEWLKTDALYPILPHGGLIWVARIGLLLAVVLHMWSAFALRGRTASMRGTSYSTFKPQTSTYAARTMMWGGIILALFIVFHLLHFTVRWITPGFRDHNSPYEMVVLSFQNWWMVLLYFVAMLAVCMHIRHGFWSAFATLGANNSAVARKWLDGLAIAVAAILLIGFMLPPVAVLIGWINV